MSLPIGLDFVDQIQDPAVQNEFIQMVAALQTWSGTVPTQPSSGSLRSFAQQAIGTALPSGTAANLSFDTNVWDTGGIHDPGSHATRFTVPVGGAGLWMIGGTLTLATSTNGRFLLHPFKNGALLSFGTDIQITPSGGVVSVQAVTFDVANDGDYYQLAAYQNTGGSLTTSTGRSGTTGFAIRLT